MKMLARTTGNFQLYNHRLGVSVPEDGVGVVTACGWVDTQINQGQLQILSGPLSDEVTSEMVEDVFCQFERDEEATVEYFQESHPFEGELPHRNKPSVELDSVTKQIQRFRAAKTKEAEGAKPKTK